uniref:EB domain-containing protein n=2 Tax=Lutzomyia longipalpis TaxID=7200 RepID=A0A1B0CAY1_LUTLO
MRKFGALMPHRLTERNHEMPQKPARPMRLPSERLRSALLVASMAILAIGLVKGDNDNGGDLLGGFSLGPEITTTEFGLGDNSMRKFGALMPHRLTERNHEMPQKPARPMRLPSERLRSALLVASMAILAIGLVKGDNDNGGDLLGGFSLGPEITTTEFDYSNRGNRKFGDKCEVTNDCGFPGSICDSKKKSCQCVPELPATNHIDKCGKEAAINESCFFNEQCEALNFQTECRDGRCICRFEMSPVVNKDGSIECKGKNEPIEPVTYVDPAMIGVLVGMALMFVIICVVLRLFSR